MTILSNKYFKSNKNYFLKFLLSGTESEWKSENQYFYECYVTCCLVTDLVSLIMELKLSNKSLLKYPINK